jgi:hypothetical protein
MDAANALKCFHSPEPVLNNRFIVLKQSPTNILDGDKIPAIPKYATRKGTPKKPFGKKKIIISEEELKMKEEAKAVVASKLKQQYDDLKVLRQETDSLLKQKISLLQGQIDQYTNMIAKLEAGAESDSRQKMINDIEVKLLSLRGQMNALVSERDSAGQPIATSKSSANEQTRHVGGRQRASNWRGGRARFGRFSNGGRIVNQFVDDSRNGRPSAVQDEGLVPSADEEPENPGSVVVEHGRE